MNFDYAPYRCPHCNTLIGVINYRDPNELTHAVQHLLNDCAPYTNLTKPTR